jgi:hypothetical protein
MTIITLEEAFSFIHSLYFTAVLIVCLCFIYACIKFCFVYMLFAFDKDVNLIKFLFWPETKYSVKW